MSNSEALVVMDDDAALIERAIIGGDLERLTPQDRTNYYMRLCSSLGLNPLTRPFEYVKLSGKMTLYARKDCGDQLRKIHGVSIAFLARETTDDGVHIVTARATTKDGRSDEATGAVFVQGLRGENLANALMKAETKAKRRATLSICGLGWLDETEVADVPGAQVQGPPSPRMLTQNASPTPEQLADRARTGSRDACDEVLRIVRAASKPSPRIEAIAYRRLAEMAGDEEDLALTRRRAEAAGLPAEIHEKLVAYFEQRAAELRDHGDALEEPAA